MNAFIDVPSFRVKREAKSRAHVLFRDADVAEVEQALLQRLDSLPAGALLQIDFTGVRISSEAARRLLRRALLRLAAGELTDRYLVLGDLGENVYNVSVMLAGESLVAVERSEEEGVVLRGEVDQVIKETHQFLLSVPIATASMLQQRFKLTNISTATNRLTALAKLALARRVEQRPVAGGGREFVYAAVR